MDIKKIKDLVKLIENSSITEFNFEDGDLKIKLSKSSQQISVPSNASLTQQVVVPAEPKIAETKQEAPKEDNSNLHEVLSPIVGTFYRAPAPDADPFVKEGDTVSEGQVLCIVEAMKLMNEIESDVNGKIAKILVENGSPVEYNQPLFLVEKK